MEAGVTVYAPIRRLEAIESQKGALIDKVVEFFRERQALRQASNEMRAIEIVPVATTQLQNLVRLAQNTSSVKEICLFIRYQIGREDPERRWRNGEFGSRLIAAIEEVARIPEQQVSIRESGVSPIDLVRLFLGYFQREAVYQETAAAQGAGEGGEGAGGEEHV